MSIIIEKINHHYQQEWQSYSVNTKHTVAMHEYQKQ